MKAKIPSPSLHLLPSRPSCFLHQSCPPPSPQPCRSPWRQAMVLCNNWRSKTGSVDEPNHCMGKTFLEGFQVKRLVCWKVTGLHVFFFNTLIRSRIHQHQWYRWKVTRIVCKVWGSKFPNTMAPRWTPRLWDQQKLSTVAGVLGIARTPANCSR